MKTKFRDLVIIISILVIGITGFFMFRNAFSQAKYGSAIVYYDGQIVAIVDFNTKKVTPTQQSDTTLYPQLDEENNTITVLGAPQDGERYEVVIEYNYENQTMQVISETSPNKDCFKQGISNSFPINCLPNRVEIIFKDASGNTIHDGTI